MASALNLPPEAAPSAETETETVPQASATRRKVTGAELEEQFAAWREQRGSRPPRDGARALRRGLVATMGAAILSLALFSGVTGDQFAVKQSENTTQITALEQQLTEAQVLPEEGDASAWLVEMTEAAAQAAKAVAAAQQRFSVLHFEADRQPGTDNGAPNSGMIATVDHRRELARFFDAGSYVAADKDAYVWQNVLPFDVATRMDPRFAWYVRYDGRLSADPDTYQWSVETVMPDLDSADGSGKTDRAQVIWLCRDTTTGGVLAWASSAFVYDGGSGLFQDLAVVLTPAGAADQYPTSDQEPEAMVPPVETSTTPVAEAADDTEGDN